MEDGFGVAGLNPKRQGFDRTACYSEKQLAGTLEKYRKTCETKFLRSRVAKRLAGTLEEHQKYKKENEDEQQRKVLHDHRDCLHIR